MNRTEIRYFKADSLKIKFVYPKSMTVLVAIKIYKKYSISFFWSSNASFSYIVSCYDYKIFIFDKVDVKKIQLPFFQRFYKYNWNEVNKSIFSFYVLLIKI